MTRTIGYAGLILIALASRDVLAQIGFGVAAPAPIVIIATVPSGQTTITVQAPPEHASFRVDYRTPEHICNWPTPDRIRNALSSDSSTLLNQLNAIESFGTSSGLAIENALHSFIAVRMTSGIFGGTPQDDDRGNLFSGEPQLFGDSIGGYWLTQPQTRTVRTRCLTVAEARTGINEIRRVIRAYLGMPAPTFSRPASAN